MRRGLTPVRIDFNELKLWYGS